MWYEIQGSEFRKCLGIKWYAQFFSDGKKIFRWFGGGDDMDLFTVLISRGGIPSQKLRLVEQMHDGEMHLFAEYLDEFIPLGIWTKCEYPNFNWLKGLKFDEISVDILTEDGAVVETCKDPIGGGLAINVGGNITPIEEFEEGAVRIGWFTGMFWE